MVRRLWYLPVGVGIAGLLVWGSWRLSGSRTAQLVGELVTDVEMPDSLVALTFASVLIWRMTLGMNDYREYEELTPIVGFPIWMAFVPILASLALLVPVRLFSLRSVPGWMRESSRRAV